MEALTNRIRIRCSIIRGKLQQTKASDYNMEFTVSKSLTIPFGLLVLINISVYSYIDMSDSNDVI